MAKWHAEFTLVGARLDMGVLGSARMGYQCTVEADTVEKATALARANGKEFDERCRLDRIDRIGLYAVKVVSKTDKRRREEFLIKATSQDEALRRARTGYSDSGRAAERFGGYGKKQVVAGVRRVGDA